jgi:hypothetical protein
VKEISSKFLFLNFTYKTSTLPRHIGKFFRLVVSHLLSHPLQFLLGQTSFDFPSWSDTFLGLRHYPSFLEGSWPQLCWSSISWPKSRIPMLKFVVSYLGPTSEVIALTSTSSFWITVGWAKSQRHPPLPENQNHSFLHRGWEPLVFSFRTLNLPGTRKLIFLKVISNYLSKMNGDLAFKRAKCPYMYESVCLLAKCLTLLGI